MPPSHLPPSPLPPARSSSEQVSLPVGTTPPGPQGSVDPESSSDEEGEDNHEEMEIDEISDGEDDRRAHEFLQAAPVQTGTMGGNSPILLPHDNHDFAVCFLFLSSYAMRLLPTDVCHRN